jgi:hypothetical protein
MNNNKETKKEQLNSNKNQTQQNKLSLTHSEMLEYLRSTLIKRNPNISVEKNQDQTNKNENLIEVTFIKNIKKEN